MGQNSKVQILNVLALIGTIIVNGLSNWLPLNGKTAEQISNELPSLFTPAGYTFSIWGIIYLGLIGFVVYQALPAQREASFMTQIGNFFIVSCVLNAVWLVSWHYGIFWLSIVLMVSLLLTLIMIYQHLAIGQRDYSVSMAEKWLVHTPFSLYLGWITVATIANIASVLAHWGWNGFGVSGAVWSVIMMAVAVVVVFLLLRDRVDFAYPAVLVWALFGIRAGQSGSSLVMTAAIVAAVAVILVVGWSSWQKRVL